MHESCLVYCYSGIQSLYEVVLLYTFYTSTKKLGDQKKAEVLQIVLKCSPYQKEQNDS